MAFELTQGRPPLRDHLRRMVVGKQVEIRRISKDRYGRTVGELFLAGPHITRRKRAARDGRQWACRCHAAIRRRRPWLVERTGVELQTSPHG